MDFNWKLKNLLFFQACAIWLLALVKHCSNRKTILNNRKLLQMAFTDLLSEDSGKYKESKH